MTEPMFWPLAAALVAGAQPADAPLEPTAQWRLDAARGHCSLAREYVGDTTLVIRPTLLGTTAEIWLVDRKHLAGVGGSPVHEGDAKLGGASDDLRYRAYDNNESRRIRITTVDTEALGPAMADGELALDFGREGRYRLAAPASAMALDALDLCQDDLRRSVGLTPEYLSTIATNATMTRDGMGTYDYPEAMLNRVAQGDVPVFLWIDDEGRVEECIVTRTSGYEDFDEQVCATMTRRSRFDPARDAQGKAIRGFYETMISFRIR